MTKKRLDECKVQLLDIMFPNRCPFCNEFIMWSEVSCRKCGDSLESAMNVSCQNTEYPDNICAALFFNDEKVRKAVYDFKHSGAPNLAEYTASVTENVLRNDHIDVVTSVPMGRKKRSKRGFNQADILAKCIGKRLDTSVNLKLIIKSDTDEEQHTLSREDRQEHVRSLFSGNGADLSGKNVLICDDVITTGSTLNECARILKNMGAARVIAVACAATKLEKITEKGD